LRPGSRAADGAGSDGSKKLLSATQVPASGVLSELVGGLADRAANAADQMGDRGFESGWPQERVSNEPIRHRAAVAHLSREQPRHIRTVLYCIAHAIDDFNLRRLQRRLAGNPSRVAHFARSGLMVRVQRDVNRKLAIKIRLEDSQIGSSSKCRTPSDSYAAMPPD